MEYKLTTVQAIEGMKVDFDKAGAKLAAEVNKYLAEGWEPQGGVCFGVTTNLGGHPYLLQALVRK